MEGGGGGVQDKRFSLVDTLSSHMQTDLVGEYFKTVYTHDICHNTSHAWILDPPLKNYMFFHVMSTIIIFVYGNALCLLVVDPR